MRRILIISTGGTFNKVYNRLTGVLDIDKESTSLYQIASKWLCNFELMCIIGKDSLDMTNEDRLELLSHIHQSDVEDIIVIHGTDTMHLTAEYLADAELEKCIVLTGAMVPYSIDPTEATANLASAYGYISALDEHGVYIAMNGNLGSHEEIKKDKQQGKFTTAR